MKKALQKKMQQLVDEETRHDADAELLDELRNLASEETMYAELAAPIRNSLNVFFKEMKDVAFNEFVSGNYGADIIIDTLIVTSFETGYKLKEKRAIR